MLAVVSVFRLPGTVSRQEYRGRGDRWLVPKCMLTLVGYLYVWKGVV